MTVPGGDPPPTIPPTPPEHDPGRPDEPGHDDGIPDVPLNDPQPHPIDDPPAPGSPAGPMIAAA